MEKNREEMDSFITIFEQSGYFLKSPEHCTSNENKNRNNMIIAFGADPKFSSFVGGMITAFLSGLTLSIFPFFDRDDYILRVQLKRNDKLIKEYSYNEHIMTTIQLFLLFKKPDQSPRKPIREIYGAMIMNFLYDYSHDLQQGVIALED